MAKRPRDEAGDTFVVSKRPKPAANEPSLQVPLPASLTAWSLSEVSKSTPNPLPPLPPILDSTLEKCALTHAACAPKPLEESYERLEWLGDAYLEIISSGFIYHTFPKLTAGQLSQVRELLVCNATLEGFCRQYGLDKRATLPEEYYGGREGGTSMKEKERVKIRGDIFEAYVAAAILSDPEVGISRVSAWLKELWPQVIKRQLEAEGRRRAHVAAAGGENARLRDPKEELQVEIVVPGVKLRYEDVESRKKKDRDHKKLNLHTVGVFLDGWGETDKKLGWGSALSKKEAGQKAAQTALDNKKLIAIYAAKKKAFLAARAAQAANAETEP